jgi:lipoate-protein ligase A
LHFYRRDPPGISLGYFKKIEEDVDLRECSERGVVVVRRTSGGGTIFTDKHTLIYGLVTGRKLGRTVEDSFKVVCGAIVKALGSLGIESSYKPPNDITVNGKKVSGSAQILKENVMLMHGTVILDMDTELMGAVLKEKKPGYVSSIKQETGKDIRVEDMKKCLTETIMDALNSDFSYGELSEYENKLIEELIQNKYGRDEWNLKR